MERRKLPIEQMSNSQFSDWRRKFLDAKVLGPEFFLEIERVFYLDGPASLRCGEVHQHDYSCLSFDDPFSAIVSRLAIELQNYRARLNQIRERADYTK